MFASLADKVDFRSSVIAKLSNDRSENSGFCYFYCDGNYPGKQDVVNIIGSFCKQLLRQASSEVTAEQMKCISKLHKEWSSGGINHHARMVEMLFILKAICRSFEHVKIVVDGLDECATRRDLLDVLQKLAEGSVSVLVSSRPEGDIKKAFEGKHVLEMDESMVQLDIETHLSWCFNHDSRFKDIKQDLREQIMEKLTSKNGGM